MLQYFSKYLDFRVCPPALFVVVLERLKYLTLRSCLIYRLRYSLVCVLKIPFHVFFKFVPENRGWFHCVALFELFLISGG